jgi:NADPH-dependent 2,4-dienoyl-CoA reductase/sulfur reductase-like enzyme
MERVKDVKYLLIGGGMASYHAGRQIRKADPEGSILMVCEEPLPPYDRPPLSKEYLRGEKTTDEILFDSIEKLAEQKIDLALGVRAESLDPATKTVTLADGETVHFDKAFLATGGRPIRLPIPGADLPGVFYLRDAADADAIGRAVKPGTNALIIGAGFIGIEVAASLTKKGADVMVVEAMPHIWSRFADERLADYIQEYCTRRGVTFLTGELVSELRGDGRVQVAETKSGQMIACDLVCIGIGIVPNVELAQEAGLEVNNGIVVDEYGRTSHPDIYAAGDVVNYYDPVFEKRRRVEHWGHAEYGGQIAGRNMAGGENAYDFLSYVWSDIFDLHIEFAGDESEHDQILLRGKMEDDSFTQLYMKQGVMTAYFSVNTDMRDFVVLRRMIRTKKDLTGREADLENKEFNLRELLQ